MSNSNGATVAARCPCCKVIFSVQRSPTSKLQESHYLVLATTANIFCWWWGANNYLYCHLKYDYKKYKPFLIGRVIDDLFLKHFTYEIINFVHLCILCVSIPNDLFPNHFICEMIDFIHFCMQCFNYQNS